MASSSLWPPERKAIPGTVAGTFDAEAHGFVNHGFAALMADMTAALPPEAAEKIKAAL